MQRAVLCGRLLGDYWGVQGLERLARAVERSGCSVSRGLGLGRQRVELGGLSRSSPRLQLCRQGFSRLFHLRPDGVCRAKRGLDFVE